ncbi:tRNA (uridine(54)-C5)-methyltransferase TrmA [Endozoicomonas sp.]|uniref:tRNA (uridine(54)-C5)-methyltransferase TrmA n=1 Tax=Endozoicomonas sp. TaxID=1892382 RepID=UPI0028847CDD|nr:tRNA (uridine(54)-C5)-methyltransferase TrmA [Endozoicomonas sp.]
MSLPTVQPERYEAQLAEKASRIRSEFAEFDIPELALFRSQPEHYRMRAEFHVWHEGDHSCYRMFDPQTKQPFEVTSFPSGSETINRLMMPLMEAITASHHLRKRLFQVEFLTTQTGEALISLLYHRQLDDHWKQEASELQERFGIGIIGRARKQKRVLDKDYVTETLTVDGKSFRYTQVENSFTQPNAGVNEHMLSWASRASQDIASDSNSDLLELYCGNGNFTCVLAGHFEQVLATEIAKTSVHSARENFKLNDVDNVEIARLSSEEFTQAINKEREFRRLSDIDLDSYHFSTILIDPPRAGLDEGTEKLVQNFDNILYISCNPETLKQNLSTICQTHKVEKTALFDQFPYTHHVEMGVHLIRK